MSVSPNPRVVAAGLFGLVLERGRALDDALADPKTGFGELSERDRAFVRRLIATGLRRRGQVDAALRNFLSQWPKGLPGEALRMGATELLFLNAPPHAAVHGAVDVLPAAQSKARGLVNAVLRRVASEGGAIVAAQDAARLNTPDWLWRSWSAAYGEDRALAIAQAHLQEAPLDISVQSNRPGRDLHDWATTLDAELLPSGSLRRLKPGPVEALPGYDEGGWWVQDAAAALPVAVLARLFGGSLQSRTVADLCAAPGGKTAQLASLGAAVTAVDRSEARLQKLKTNLDRLRLIASVVCADIETWLPAETFDAVLLDAPCSATGTIRRHPDLPHLKSEADIAKLSQLQRRLIARAWTILEPAGYLLYCVCSLQHEEGEDQLAILRALPGAELVPLKAAAFGLPEEAAADGCLRTLPSMWPERGGMDGFFITALKKAE